MPILGKGQHLKGKVFPEGMIPKRGFAKTYFIIALIFGLLGLVDILLSFLHKEPVWYASTISILLFFFFFFNILAIALFHHHHMENIAFVLPVYHLVSYVIFLGIGLWLSTQETLLSWIDPTLLTVGVITSSFEILFSFYLLAHVKNLEAGKTATSHMTR